MEGKKIQEHSPILDLIVEILQYSNVQFSLTKHDPVVTSEEAAKIRGNNIKEGAKALLFYGDKEPLMFVLPGDRKLASKKIKKSLGVKDLRMMTADEIRNISGLEIGAVPPFGNCFEVPVYVDKNLLENENISFNAGSHVVSIRMTTKDYLKVTPHTEGDFVREE